ncbi:S9 family peptidase [Aeromicrobium sp. Root472D3]|uniref:alpha/beta hydrolase family protein n=1 Tax=Aeromicrobium sp. Root472D3 TaxID=1736540 RepID=UPI0009EB186C|nr:alpha/beta hydrolase [Aeromicrobium sp. Root472D3]
MDRRSALATLALGALAAACSGRGGTDDDGGRETRVEVIRYGDDPSQRAELTRPSGSSKGVVVVIHGGFWRDQYDLSLGRPLATSLVAEGWTAYNVEYRRVGNGGGWPETFDDVAAAIDRLAEVDGVDTAKVVTLGHSAGGHLAVWAAGRPRLTDERWTSPAVPVTAAVSQAGVLDLAAAIAADLGSGAVQRFMGGTVDDRYAEADPAALVPLGVPVRCVHGTDDTTVPLSQSTGYVERATAAGADATLTEVEGDHFVVIDPASRAWAQTLEILDAL